MPRQGFGTASFPLWSGPKIGSNRGRIEKGSKQVGALALA
jgi:hypothetical protein